MSELSQYAGPLIERYGLEKNAGTETAVPGVKLYYQCQPMPRAPLLYRSGIVIIINGRKIVHLGDQRIAYDADNYLALGLPLAMECETDASEEDPVLALYIEVDPLFVREVALAMHFDRTPDPRVPAVAAAPLGPEMMDAVGRLMRQLCSDSDTEILGQSTVREIVYRVLQGPAGIALQGLLNVDGQTAKVADVMSALHQRYAERFSVEEMARMAGMSTSVFHRAFRQVTNETPLQYLKKLRLSHASTLIAQEGYRVGMAANAVGYESAAQFSRDFKSHFGVSAVDAKRAGAAFMRTRPLAQRPVVLVSDG
ncbi:MAG: AraC family transcriptional regulator [Pseudomonadota bacterium]